MSLAIILAYIGWLASRWSCATSAEQRFDFDAWMAELNQPQRHRSLDPHSGDNAR